MENSIPRGLRNNNPLNLRKSENAWLGKCPDGKDPEFEQFMSILYGIRAAFINVRTIIRRHQHKCTLVQLISTWAPASDGNNTRAYIARVAKLSRIKPDDLLVFKDKTQMVELLWAMAWVECGQAVLHRHFENAYEMV